MERVLNEMFDLVDKRAFEKLKLLLAVNKNLIINDYSILEYATTTDFNGNCIDFVCFLLSNIYNLEEYPNEPYGNLLHKIIDATGIWNTEEKPNYIKMISF